MAFFVVIRGVGGYRLAHGLKGIYLYKSSENVYNNFNCKNPPPPPPPPPPKSAFMHS